jgi:hypothetical protein
MARIRTIKPEFFDDEDICALSPLHRLCYAGLWCQADKAGRLEDRPKRLKARVLPFDDVNMDAMLTDLVQAGFIIRYAVDSKQYITIKPTAWAKHQRPRNDEPESVLPPVDTATVFVSSLVSDEHVTAETLGKEGKGRERKGREGADFSSAADDFGVLWNEETSAPIPKCLQLTAKRRRHINARLAERPLTEWCEVFRRIHGSAFCRGYNDRGWIATFDWVIGSADVAVKVLEGKYDDRRKPPERSRAEPAYVDWGEECKQLHGGECTKRWDHELRMKESA